MKNISILVAIALIAVIYSCGNNNSKENSKSKSSTKVDNISNNETQKANTVSEPLRDLLKNIEPHNIHIIKYKGTLGKSNITVQLQNRAVIIKDNMEVSVYMYDKINNPLALEYDKTKNYICLNELFPKKKTQGYKKGGTLSFKNNKELAFEMTGEYINPKGTKTYPVHLKAVEIITRVQKENFEELQEHRTDKHYFTVESAWGVGFYDDTIRFVRKINVYDKKTNRKLQSLPVSFGKYYSLACVEPTNTKPNGIQIGCCPRALNDNVNVDYIAFLPKNGKYEKDSLVKGHDEYDVGTMYRGYNENGDIVEQMWDMYNPYRNVIYVTTNDGFSENINEDIRNNMLIINRTYKTYSEEITIMPFDYSLDSNKKPPYMATTKTDKKTGKKTVTVETNYPKNSYKLSANGKILLEWNDPNGVIIDFNGQDDLRKVEKIDINAFDKYSDELFVDSFAIVLNPNFNSIPEAIEKHGRLMVVTVLHKTTDK